MNESNQNAVPGWGAIGTGQVSHTVAAVEGNGYVPMTRHVNQTIAQAEQQSDVHPWSDCVSVFDVMDTAHQQLIANADINRPAAAATPFTY